MLLLSACAATAPGGGAQTVSYGKAVTIDMVTHGSPSDPFWVTLRQGAAQAAKDYNVHLLYQTSGATGAQPESTLIQQAVARHPQGMVVTIPNPSVDAAVHQAASAVPTVAMNAGQDQWQALGALDFIGQDETEAGQEAGRQLVQAGLKDVLCVVHEQGNVVLTTRAQEITQTVEAAGGAVTTINVPGTNEAQSATEIGAALAQNPGIQVIMALGPPGFAAAQSALQTAHMAGLVKVATFDATTAILQGVAAGQTEFAVNQQPYLQGYYSVQIVAQQLRFGLHPYRQVFTGPAVVTKSDAAGALTYAKRQSGMLSYSEPITIDMVSHGSPVDPFWSSVQQGAEQAARDFNVKLDYSAPNLSGSPPEATLIDKAVKAKPDAIALTIPDAQALGGAIRSAVASGRPVLAYNVGQSTWQSLGALDFIGQDETESGQEAGQRLVQAGVKHVLCVIGEKNNVALETRCAEVAAALQAQGGTSQVLNVQGTSVPAMTTAINSALDQDSSVDALLATGSTAFAGIQNALAVSNRLHKYKVASFDTSSQTLAAVQRGQTTFTVDQQPYLEGYFAVEILAQQVRLGLHPFRQIYTGPSLVTKQNVAKVIAFENEAGNGQLSQIQVQP